jgi:hypothetical protein
MIRPGNPFYIAGLIAFAFFLAPVCSSASPLSPSRDWEPVAYSHGAIVAVGKSRLPWPVTLPAGLKPTGDMAFVTRDAPGGKVTGFIFSFRASDEAKIKAWADSMPKQFPLPAGSYTLDTQFAPVHQELAQAHSWLFVIFADTKTGSLSVMMSGEPWNPTEGVEKEKFARFKRAFLQPGCPVLHESRFVAFELGISDHKMP